MAKASEFRVLIHRVLTGRTGDTPLHVIRHFLKLLIHQIRKGQPFGIPNGLFERPEMHRTVQCGEANFCRHRRDLEVASRELPVGLGPEMMMDLDADDHGHASSPINAPAAGEWFVSSDGIQRFTRCPALSNMAQFTG